MEKKTYFSIGLKAFAGVSCAAFSAMGLGSGSKGILQTMCILGSGYSSATLLKSAWEDLKAKRNELTETTYNAGDYC